MVSTDLFGLVHAAFMCCQHILKSIKVHLWIPLPQLIQLGLHGGVLSHQPPSFIHLKHSHIDVQLHAV